MVSGKWKVEGGKWKVKSREFNDSLSTNYYRLTTNMPKSCSDKLVENKSGK